MLILDLLRGWWGVFTLYGGGKGGAPAAPDYTGAANAESAASKEIAAQNTWANRPTLNTPWGQQTWDAQYGGVDPATGAPVTSWTSNINLTPESQSALDAQQRIGAGRSAAAEQLLGQATSATATPFDWSKMPEVGSLDDAQKDAYTKMSALIEPGRSQQREGLETRLANMGFGMGSESEAAKRARAEMEGNFATQDKSLLSQALSEGRANIGTSSQLRQQAIAEEAQRRGMPLSELNALLTQQQVNMPQMPSFNGATAGQAPQLLQAANMQGQYGMDAANMNANSGIDFGSLIGTAAKVGMMASDMRLKSNICWIGTHARGIGIYRYMIFGREEVGVLAQELLEVAPELVVKTTSGFLAVDYGGL